MDSRAKQIVQIGNKAFSDKRTVDSLWQEIAYNFYPEMATFTNELDQGEEFADHLFSSYPVLARQELGNLLSSALRPQSQKWFSHHVDDEALDNGNAERRFMEYLTKTQFNAMYHHNTGFVKATKQCDHDYVTFGNGVIYTSPNAKLNGLLFQNFHLRDNAWSENGEGEVDCNHRNWEPTARQLKHLFPKDVSSEVTKAYEKDPEKKFACRHVVMPTELYDWQKKGGKKFPYVSLYVECETEKVLEEVGVDFFPYVIPRWKTISGSPYGRSMATEVALPDSRTMQVVVRTLREAGEKYVNPPMIAIADAIRGDIASYPGGITTADIEYDSKLSEVLRPLTQESKNMPVGFEIAAALREDIRNAYFLDKINLPQTGTDMTAFEVRRRIDEHIRGSSPLFEPIEKEYNTKLCENAFHIQRMLGGFDMSGMPDSLQGQSMQFSFRSPLADMSDANDAEIYKETMATIFMPAAQIDPAQLANINLTEATRDAARATGWKAEWLNDEKVVEQERQRIAQQQAQEAQMAQLQQAAELGQQGGAAVQAMKEAGG